MLAMVTRGFYDRSRLALWMFEAIGREYDDMAKWARELKFEAFPQTCTWSAGIWESAYGTAADGNAPLHRRRERLLAKKMDRPPISPARVEAALSLILGCPVEIKENIAPHTFGVTAHTADGETYNFRSALSALRKLKQSHMSFRFEYRASAECTLYIAPAVVCMYVCVEVEVQIYGLD